MADTQTKIQDIDIYGRSDAAGNPILHEQDLAVSNALVSWFTSKAGDYIYRPDLGGVLDRSVFKLMTADRNAALKKFFTDEINANFGGVLNLINVTVTPDSTARLYTIEISYISLLTNKTNLARFDTKPQESKTPVVNFLQIPFIGENLTNFAIAHSYDLRGKKMIFDDITGFWTWGPFQFINLRNEDYNFAALYNYLNVENV